MQERRRQTGLARESNHRACRRKETASCKREEATGLAREETTYKACKKEEQL